MHSGRFIQPPHLLFLTVAVLSAGCASSPPDPNQPPAYWELSKNKYFYPIDRDKFAVVTMPPEVRQFRSGIELGFYIQGYPGRTIRIDIVNAVDGSAVLRGLDFLIPLKDNHVCYRRKHDLTPGRYRAYLEVDQVVQGVADFSIAP